MKKWTYKGMEYIEYKGKVYVLTDDIQKKLEVIKSMLNNKE